MALACLRAAGDKISLAVHAIPRSSRNEVVDFTGDRCRIKVKAPPVDGEANEELVAFLSKVFGVAKRQISLEGGSSGKQKVFFVSGVSLEQAETALSVAGSGKTRK